MYPPYLCILISYYLIYMPRWTLVAGAMLKSEGGYDNVQPRVQHEGLKGAPLRALWAHQNAFESFAPFVASVLMAKLAAVPDADISQWSMIFVGARVLYTVSYIANWHPIRSLGFVVGMAAITALMVLAMQA